MSNHSKACKIIQDIVKERRELIVEKTNSIPGISCNLPNGAFYTMPNIKKTGLSSKEMETLLLENLKIASVAGTSFGEYGEGYIRFSYANSKENITGVNFLLADCVTWNILIVLTTSTLKLT